MMKIMNIYDKNKRTKKAMWAPVAEPKG